MTLGTRAASLALALMAVLVLGACASESTAGAGGSAGTSAGGSGGAGSCAKETTCGDAQSGCTACAEQSICISEYDSCEKSMDCLSYGRCLEPCAEGDTECVADCQNKFPLGGSEYQRLLNCVICGPCSTVCDAAASGCTS